MPIFKTAYDTTTGKVFVTRTLAEPLLKAFVAIGQSDARSLGLKPVGGVNAYFICGLDPSENNISSFVHPVLIEDFKKNQYLCTDIRPYLSKKPESSWPSVKEVEDCIRHKADYLIAKLRTRLTQKWLEPHEREAMRSEYAFAGNVLAAWITQALARNYALDFADQGKITAVCLYYYRLLFTEGSVLTDNAREAAVVHIIKTTKMSATAVYELLDKVGEITNIEGLCEALKRVVENVRLERLEFRVLWALVQNSWYGINNKEILSAALEHPPTLIALVFGIIKEQAFRSSAMFKLIEPLMKRADGDAFVRAVNTLVLDEVLVAEQADDDIIFPEFQD